MESRSPRTPPSPEAPDAWAFLGDPEHGRLFSTTRTVRSTDVTPAGRLRFDALARYLQQAAEDDLADAGWAAPYTWLARRTAVRIHGYPAHRERVTLRTFCSGTGPRWAERTTTLAAAGRDLMQATAVWVAIAPADGRPVPLGDKFYQLYGSAAGDRRVSARLSHPGPPGSVTPRAWPLRAADFDTAGHVNNSIHWAAVEDVLGGVDWLPASAELEYHHPVLPGHDLQLLTGESDGHTYVWLCDGPQRLASARLTAPAAGVHGR
jgi:acyl-ACP thioesterase